jgi:hypothetical protein
MNNTQALGYLVNITQFLGHSSKGVSSVRNAFQSSVFFTSKSAPSLLRLCTGLIKLARSKTRLFFKGTKKRSVTTYSCWKRYLQAVKIRNRCSNVAQLTCIVFAPSTHQLLFDMQIGDLTPQGQMAKLLPYDRELVLDLHWKANQARGLTCFTCEVIITT